MWASAPTARNLISQTAQKMFGPRASSRVKLLGAQVIHRHGDRTPINQVLGMDEFWQDKIPDKASLGYLDERFPLVGVEEADLHNNTGINGRLTHRGMLQLKQLGRQLQEDYTALHGTNLDPARLVVHSTKFLRTVQSVQSLLDGLFEETPHGDDAPVTKGSSSGDEAPFRRPVKEISPLSHVDPFGVIRSNAAASKRMSEIKQAFEQDFDNQVVGFMESVLAEYHKLGILDAERHRPGQLNWLDVLEVSICLNCYGKLPEAHSSIMGDLMGVAIHRWHSLFTDVELSRMVSGELLRALHTRVQESVLEERAAEKEGQAFAPHVTIYSSHDSSVYSLLHALNNELGPQVWALPETTNGGIGSTAPAHLADIIDFAGEVPPYASTVTVAAWKDLEPVPASTNAEPDQEYCVEITFNGQTAFVPKAAFDNVPERLSHPVTPTKE
eukprot:INCI7637.3.p2 GENE.INCI7637.3~~INCI7637.3.p2  ORF type:complete len:442 (+),score=77.46 INCI7637.3:49-1374(+)